MQTYSLYRSSGDGCFLLAFRESGTLRLFFAVVWVPVAFNLFRVGPEPSALSAYPAPPPRPDFLSPTLVPTTWTLRRSFLLTTNLRFSVRDIVFVYERERENACEKIQCP